MSREVESVGEDDRVRSALRELAAGAQLEPSRPLSPMSVFESPRGEPPRRRGVIVAAAVAILIAAIGFVAARSPDQVAIDGIAPSTESVPPSVTTPGSSPTGWFTDLAPDSAAVLPEAPISGRVGPASVWTGTEMLVWGGSAPVSDGSGGEVPLSDGAAFDPLTGRWRMLPEPPIEGRAYAATVWTGTEMIVWGGSQSATMVAEGAAFDPATGEWRVLATGPLGPASKSAVVWTGHEMIIVGGLNGDGSAAAYDPVEDSWRELPDPPGAVAAPYPTAVWTGEAVLTAMIDGRAIDRLRVASYRPDVDRWEIVQHDIPFGFLVGVPGANLGTVGDDVVVLTLAPDAAIPVLDPFGAVGLELQPAPSPSAPLNAFQPIWSGDEILLWSGGDRGLALDPVGDQWRQFPAGDVASRVDAAIVWADGVMLTWGGFVSNPDGTASAAADGIIYRPTAPPSRSDSGPEPSTAPRHATPAAPNVEPPDTVPPTTEPDWHRLDLSEIRERLPEIRVDHARSRFIADLGDDLGLSIDITPDAHTGNIEHCFVLRREHEDYDRSRSCSQRDHATGLLGFTHNDERGTFVIAITDPAVSTRFTTDICTSTGSQRSTDGVFRVNWCLIPREAMTPNQLTFARVAFRVDGLDEDLETSLVAGYPDSGE